VTWRQVGLWLPPLAWMALLFAASSRSDVPAASALPDWLTHGLAYLALGVLLARALAGGLGAPLGPRQALLAVLLATAYGVSDEYHQSFVPGRQADPYDVLKDCAGASVGAALCRALGRRREERSGTS
jgi:VanZ family protein